MFFTLFGYGACGGVFGMMPWCDDLLADRHSLPFPWTLSLHRRWCPSASHHPLTFLFRTGGGGGRGGGLPRDWCTTCFCSFSPWTTQKSKFPKLFFLIRWSPKMTIQESTTCSCNFSPRTAQKLSFPKLFFWILWSPKMTIQARYVKHVLARSYVVFALFWVCVAWGRCSARWTC